jgi:hypothetical protein
LRKEKKETKVLMETTLLIQQANIEIDGVGTGVSKSDEERGNKKTTV